MGIKYYCIDNAPAGLYLFGEVGYLNATIKIKHSGTNNRLSDIIGRIGFGYNYVMFKYFVADLCIGHSGRLGKQKEWISLEGEPFTLFKGATLFMAKFGFGF